MINEKYVKWEEKDLRTNFNCPCCSSGKLVIKKDLYKEKQYQWNIPFTDREGQWLVHEYQSSASGLLVCDQCGDCCSFLGEVYGGEDYFFDEVANEHMSANEFHLTFKYINPPVNLIEIHKEYPSIIKDLLKESFSLFWNHEASCLNKLRILVEEILNDLSIGKKAKIKNGLNTGKFRNLSAHGRILKLGEKVKYKEASDYLLALKWLGNEGSHSNIEVNNGELNETYEILHKALDLIYVKTGAKLKKRVDEINKNKGR